MKVAAAAQTLDDDAEALSDALCASDSLATFGAIEMCFD